LAVAVKEVSTLLERELSHQLASDLAVEAYQQFGSALIGYLRRNLKSIEDAHDLAQDVYLRIAGHQRPADVRSLKSFTFTIARNLLIDRSRRCETVLTDLCVPFENIALPSAQNDPGDELQADQCLYHLNAEFAGLRPACRKAFLLNRVEGYTYRAIAEKMNVSVSMIEKYIGTALEALRRGAEKTA
jgi:RNA polymerase sigma-70 factor (ECF subfamily)